MSSSTSSRELDEMKKKFIQSESEKLDKVKTLLDTIKSIVEEDKKKEEEIGQMKNPSLEDDARLYRLEADLGAREVKSFKNIATIENFNSGDSTSNMTIQIQLYEIKMNPRDLDNYDDQKVTENLIEIFDLDKCFINQFPDMKEEIEAFVKNLKEKIKKLENVGPEVENDLKELKEELSQYQFTEEETYYLHFLHVENGTPDDYNELSKVLNLKKMSEDETLLKMKKNITKFVDRPDANSNFVTSTAQRYMETFILEHHETRIHSQRKKKSEQPLWIKLKKWTPQDDLYCLKPGCVHYKIQGTTMDIASLYLRKGTGTHSGATTVDNVTFKDRDLPDILRISDKVSNLRNGYKTVTGKTQMYLHHFNKCNVIPIDIVDTRIYLLTPTLFFKPYTELTEQISKFTTKNLKEVLERDTQTLFSLRTCRFKKNEIAFHFSFNWMQFMEISNYFFKIPNLENLEKSRYRDIIFRYDLGKIKIKKKKTKVKAAENKENTPFSFLMDLKAKYLKENDETRYDLEKSDKRQREEAEKYRQELNKNIPGFDDHNNNNVRKKKKKKIDVSDSNIFGYDNEDDNNNNETELPSNDGDNNNNNFPSSDDEDQLTWAFDTEEENREKAKKKKKKTTTTTTTRSRNDKRKRTNVDEMEKIGEAIETLFKEEENITFFLNGLLQQCESVKTVKKRQKCIDFLNLVLLYCWVTFVNKIQQGRLMDILLIYIDEKISTYLGTRLSEHRREMFRTAIEKLNFVFKNFKKGIPNYVNFTEDIKTWDKLIDGYEIDEDEDPINDKEKEEIKQFVRDHYNGPL